MPYGGKLSQKEDTLNYQSLSSLMRYDAETGELWWLVKLSNRARLDKPAGTWSNGYLQVQVLGSIYKAHRLAWLLHYKVWPTHTIDHINRNPSDNRIVNLRDVPIQRNTMNGSAHGDSEFRVKGVTYDYKYPSKPFRVEISRRGKVVHRSCHATIEEATKASNDFYASE